MPPMHSRFPQPDQAAALPELNIFRSTDRPTADRKDGLVEGLFRTSEMVLLVGESNSGKSGAALDLALCVVHGMKWKGHKTKKSGALYCAGESPPGIEALEKAWNQHHKKQRHENMFFLEETFDLDKPEHVEWFKKQVRAIEQATGVKIGLIVLDTFVDFLGDAEENSNTELRQVMRAIQLIARDLDAAVVIVHHMGKDASKGARGGTATNAKADLRLDCTKEAGFTNLAVGKLRRGKTGGWKQLFRKEVAIGKDDWGNDDTSYVMVPRSEASDDDFAELEAFRAAATAAKKRQPAAAKKAASKAGEQIDIEDAIAAANDNPSPAA
jgi:hypothetical protein